LKKEQNGRESLRRLKLIVGCNASKRRRRKIIPSQHNTSIQTVFSANRADKLSLTCPTIQNNSTIIRNIFYTVN